MALSLLSGCFVPQLLLLFLILRGVWWLCGLVVNAPGILLGVATGGISVKCASRYWELMLRNVDRPVGLG